MVITNESPGFIDNINTVFNCIEDAINNDNIITDEDFIKIQKLKKELHIASRDIYLTKKADIDRILYLQFYLLLLDDTIDSKERKEIEYYKEIFGYTNEELLEVEEKVRSEKITWNGT